MIDYDTCALSADNTVLSGTQLKNTEKLFAVCVYGGRETKVVLYVDTKSNERLRKKWYYVHFPSIIIVIFIQFQIALNSRININKIGSVEKMLNRFIVYFFVIMLVLTSLFTMLTISRGVEFSSGEGKACNGTRNPLRGKNE